MNNTPTPASIPGRKRADDLRIFQVQRVADMKSIDLNKAAWKGANAVRKHLNEIAADAGQTRERNISTRIQAAIYRELRAIANESH